MTTPISAPTFKDSSNREWVLVISLGHVKRLRDELGIDFANLQDGSAFVQIGTDLVKFGALLWLLCEKQADALKVDEEAFAEGINDLDAAFEALMEAIVNFTRGPARNAVREVFDQAMRAEAAAAGAMVEAVKEKSSEVIEEVKQTIRSKLDSGNLSQS